MSKKDVILTVRSTAGSGSNEKDVVEAGPCLLSKVVGFLSAEDTSHSTIVGT